MNILGNHDYGGCYNWKPLDLDNELTITPYRSLMYAIGDNEEDFGEVIITDLCGELLINSINIEPSYRNKGYEKRLIQYILDQHKAITYIYPSNEDEVYQLASLGFEPLCIEDWSNKPNKAPWNKKYREMIRLPNPNNKERISTLYKLFLVVLSDIKDAPIYEPLEYTEHFEPEHLIFIHWKWKNKSVILSSTNEDNINLVIIYEGNEISSKVYTLSNEFSFDSIKILAYWLVNNDEEIPSI